MSKQKVLIVEDEAWLAGQQRLLLEKAGFEVRVSPHAHAAIVQIDEFYPDVILLDVLLPGGTAFGLLHELQSYVDTGRIPVIICSATASELNEADLKSYGIKRILDKTQMTPEDVVAAVKGVL